MATFVGTAGDDTRTETNGNDSLSGGAGRDVLNPGLGSDTVHGGSAVDTLVIDYSSASGGVSLSSLVDSGAQFLNNNFPPFQGMTWTATDNPAPPVLSNSDAATNNDIAVTRGLIDWTYGSIPTNETNKLWWGPQVRGSMDGNSYTAGETLTATSLLNGTSKSLVMTGQTSINTFNGNSTNTSVKTVFLRYTATASGDVGGWVAGSTVIGGGPAAMIDITGDDFKISHILEASLDGSSWQPFLTFYDAQRTVPNAPGAFSSVGGSFAYDDDGVSGTISDGSSATTQFIDVEQFNLKLGAGGDVIATGSGADTVSGNGGDDTLQGASGNDSLGGGAGNDLLKGGRGDDVLDGGADQDTAVYDGARADYAATRLQNGDVQVIHNQSGPDGADTLRSIEWVRFSDQVVSAASLTNGTPSADNLSLTSAEAGTRVQITLNGTDPDGDALTYKANTIMGVALNTGLLYDAPTGGTLLLNSASYMPEGPSFTLPKVVYWQPNDENFNGQVKLTYSVTDGVAFSNTATMVLDVTPVNDAPTDLSLSNDTIQENSAPGTVVGVLSATDVDNTSGFTYSLLQNPGDKFEVVGNELRVKGALDYEAATSHLIKVQVTDAGGASYSEDLTIKVGDVQENRAPTAEDDLLVIYEDGPPAQINVGLNDSDPDGNALTYVGLGSPPKDGYGGLSSTGVFDLGLNPGTYQSLAEGEEVQSTYAYKVSDGQAEDTANITLKIVGKNDAPTVAAPLADQTSAEDAAVSFILPAGAFADVDNGAVLTLAATSKPAWLNFDAATRTFSGQPPANFNGAVDVTVSATDQAGASVSDTFTLTVTPVDDAPVAADEAASSAEDAAVLVDVLANDTDVDGGPKAILSVTQGANGAVTIQDGKVLYTPNANFNGQDSFAYTITGGDEATVSVTVTPVNDAPAGQDDSGSVDEDSAVTLAVLANDVDVDNDALTISAVTTPANGSVAVQNGQIVYTPKADFHGQDTFIYTVTDGIGGQATQTVSVKVKSVNDAPTVATPLADHTSAEDAAISFSLPAGAFADVDDANLTLAATSKPAWLNFDASTRTFSGQPPANFNGAVDVTVSATDQAGASVSDTFTLTVTPVDDAPVAADEAASSAEDAAVLVDVLANDADVDGGPKAILSVTQGANGAVTIQDGKVLYTPNANFNGQDSFAYTITGGDEATVSVTVTPVNDAPSADAQSLAGSEDVAISGTLTGADVDLEDIDFKAVVGPANGTLTLNEETGAFTYTPNTNWFGQDSFIFKANDAAGALSAEKTISLTVNSVDDRPTNGLTGAEVKKITVDETALGTSQKASYGANFDPAFGGDGQGATGAKTFALAAAEGATALRTLAGDVVSLKLDSGQVLGLAGGVTVFAVAIGSGTGEVTLKQDAALRHANGGDANDSLSLAAGLIKVVSSVTDGDGDEAKAELSLSEHLSFLDDGPALALKAGAAAPTLLGRDVDAGENKLVNAGFANLFEAKFGADGGATTYKLLVANAASGLTSINNKAIGLTVDASGKVVTGTEAGGSVAFTLSLDAMSGQVTLDQKIAMKHATNDPVALANGAVKLQAAATDGDGDAAAPLSVDLAIAFADAVAPVFVGYDTTLDMQFKNGAKQTFTVDVDYGNDVPASAVTFKSYAPFSEQGLVARINSTTGALEYAKTNDANLKPFFSIDLKDTSLDAGVQYSVGVPYAPRGLVQRIEFEKIPSGSPAEELTAKLTGGHGGSITLDGMLKDRAGKLYDPDSKSTDDDLNANSIGFGIKGGQAGQINPGEGFKVAYNSPGAGDLNHLTHLSFDVYGVGNVENVVVRYELYRQDGTLVDTGTRSTAVAFDENGVVVKSGLKLTDGLAHNIDLFDDGGTEGGANAGVGDYFDYALVSFDFPGDKANQGVRVGTFFTEIVKSPAPDAITFELQTTDADGDLGLSGLTKMTFDPAYLFA